jgi:PAS domain-containing protein/DNA-binding CsgD family transcriptional regulator
MARARREKITHGYFLVVWGQLSGEDSPQTRGGIVRGVLEREQEALERVYDAAFDDLAMERLGHTIAFAVGADYAAVSMRQGLALLSLSITAQPPDIEAYMSHYWRLDPWTPAILSLASGRFAFGDELVPHDVLDRSEFVADFARPIGVLSPMCGRLDLDADTALTFGVCRSGSMTAFSEEERRATTEMAHHARRAIQLRRRLQAAKARTDLARSALDAIAFGLALVDADGRVEIANAAFEEMARCGVGIRITAGCLSSGGAPRADPLVRLVARAARNRVGGACRLEAVDGATHVSAIVAPASPFNPFGIFSGRHALVALTAPSAAGPVAAEILAQLFGLSTAEAEVAHSLWAGNAPQQIAAERGVQLTTLKTQFEGVYRKTGAANQQELLRLFGSLPRVR